MLTDSLDCPFLIALSVFFKRLFIFRKVQISRICVKTVALYFRVASSDTSIKDVEQYVLYTTTRKQTQIKHEPSYKQLEVKMN
jgi:hypothetical protein